MVREKNSGSVLEEANIDKIFFLNNKKNATGE
jgi:hypothetical protein